jgi:hypothetical protein
MDDNVVVTPRLQQLEACEGRLKQALKTGTDAKIAIGNDLEMISTHKLYKERNYPVSLIHRTVFGWDRTRCTGRWRRAHLVAIDPEYGYRRPIQAEELSKIEKAFTWSGAVCGACEDGRSG